MPLYDALTPTQYAYLFRQEAFLQRLEERAARLAEDGYGVEIAETPYVFRVVCPQGVVTYRVHALDQTCECPFYAKQRAGEPLAPEGILVPCKHLLGLKTLLRKTRERLLTEGQECAAYRLWAHAMAVRSVERLRAIEERVGEESPVVSSSQKGDEGDECNERSPAERGSRPGSPDLSRGTGTGSGR